MSDEKLSESKVDWGQFAKVSTPEEIAKLIQLKSNEIVALMVRVNEKEQALWELRNAIQDLQAENQKLREKADKWDTFYGQELHPNPIIQAECDRIDKEEALSRLREAKKIASSMLEEMDQECYAWGEKLDKALGDEK